MLSAARATETGRILKNQCTFHTVSRSCLPRKPTCIITHSQGGCTKASIYHRAASCLAYHFTALVKHPQHGMHAAAAPQALPGMLTTAVQSTHYPVANNLKHTLHAARKQNCTYTTAAVCKPCMDTTQSWTSRGQCTHTPATVWSNLSAAASSSSAAARWLCCRPDDQRSPAKHLTAMAAVHAMLTPTAIRSSTHGTHPYC